MEQRSARSVCGLVVGERIVRCVWCVLCVVARELVLGEPASEARAVRTFSANDAAYLTLSRAVSQLRRCEDDSRQLKTVPPRYRYSYRYRKLMSNVL